MESVSSKSHFDKRNNNIRIEQDQFLPKRHNNRPYYVINNPTDGDGFYGYVYWDDTYNVWVFSNTLNGDYNFVYSTLDNFYNPNPISNGTYTWSDGVYSDDHKMNSSSIGVCP